jgi:hypothetical protein
MDKVWNRIRTRQIKHGAEWFPATMHTRLLSIPRLMLAMGACAVILSKSAAASPETNSPPPLVRAHAHNDYEHPRPLLDALEHGFGSIEADIWLMNGKLFVAHERGGMRPDRTLQSLYLDPLRERVHRNGGRLYPGGPPAILLIDVKTDADQTYAVLREVLKGYADMLTVFRDGKVRTNAITAIISGNRARKAMAAESLRYAFVDGRFEDLESGAETGLIPLVSEDWSKVFNWRWDGAMPEEVRRRLEQTVAKAHALGYKLRFWNTPDKAEAWKALFDAGVDLINTDDLAGLQKYLLKMGP